MAVLYFANSFILHKQYIYCVYTIPEYISIWQPSLQLLSLTVNSLEHITSTTHWFLPVSRHVAVYFLSLQFCTGNGNVRNWPVLIQWSTSMASCFPLLNFNQTWATLFQPEMCFHCDRGAGFLALICRRSHEHHQIFTSRAISDVAAFHPPCQLHQFWHREIDLCFWVPDKLQRHNLQCLNNLTPYRSGYICEKGEKKETTHTKVAPTIFRAQSRRYHLSVLWDFVILYLSVSLQVYGTCFDFTEAGGCLWAQLR